MTARLAPLLLALSVAAAADDAAEYVPEYTTQAKHDRNGTGTFYLGREIARVMSHRGIAWLERDTRQEEEDLSRLIELLEIESGDAVADIGTGSGVIAFLMAEEVGPEGVVHGVDIQPEMLDALRTKAEKRGVENVEPVQGEVSDPKLPAASVDLAVMVDVSHEFERPYEMLRAIARSLKIGGRVAFVEYRKEDPAIPILEVHKMSEAQVKLEAGKPGLGLRFVETKSDLPRQHVVIFERVE